MNTKYLIKKVISFTGLDKNFEWSDEVIDSFIDEAENLSVFIKHILLDERLSNDEKISRSFEILKDYASSSLLSIQKKAESTQLKSAISSVFGSKII